MWSNKKQLWKRREMLIALFLLVIGIGCFVSLRFFSQLWRPKADLSTLPQFYGYMDELAETIIPETDTPGAKSSGVATTVFRLVENCLQEREQSIFLQGLVELDAHCRHKFGHAFEGCSDAERLRALSHFESSATRGGWFVTKVRQRLFGKPFIVLVKELCAIAYCRSMQGATRALAYDPVPTRYEGCVPITEKQRSWALV